MMLDVVIVWPLFTESMTILPHEYSLCMSLKCIHYFTAAIHYFTTTCKTHESHYNVCMS